MKLVLESPLNGNFERNQRYALWIARVLTLNGHTVWASHLYAPHFLDDLIDSEREAGMKLTDAFTDDSWAHVFACDFGMSKGMCWAQERYSKRVHWELRLGPTSTVVTSMRDRQDWTGTGVLLNTHDAWRSFQAGLWPPCSRGFGRAMLGSP